MSLSRQLIDLLRELDDPGLIGYLQDLYADNPLDSSPEERSGQEFTRSLVRQLVATRRAFVSKGARLYEVDIPLEDLSLNFPDEPLDEHFTREVISNVPGMVSRWKKLRGLFVEVLPEDKARVRRYLQEATQCYLYGLPAAAVVLCRAVLESAIADALVRANVTALPDSVNRRIDRAFDEGILNGEASRLARLIKDDGDDAIHNMGCSEPKAREQIRRTAEVLQHLYRAARR